MAGKLIARKDYGLGKSFSVIIYDIIDDNVECIVNAANGGLSHGGGVAAHIAEAAGPELDSECRRIVREQGRIPVGEARATTAGNLPFSAVIHAVGPRLGDGNEEMKIEMALSSAFAIANMNGWKSLAFPAISSGIFSVPHDICVVAYCAAVHNFFRQFNDPELVDIHLCLFQGPMSEAFLSHITMRTGAGFVTIGS